MPITDRSSDQLPIPSEAAVTEEAIVPDVWWGEHGIDALLWADPTPYAPPDALSEKRTAPPS